MTHSTFILDSMVVPAIWMMARMKKMYLYLKNQTEEAMVVEWNEGIDI